MSSREKRKCVSCSYTKGEVTSPGGILFASKYWLVEHAFGTTLPGFCIIKTKRHTEDCGELGRAEAQEMGVLIQKVTRAVQAVCRTNDVYILKFGEVVKHLHIWILPVTSRTATAVGKGPRALSQILEYYKSTGLTPSDFRTLERTATKIRRVLHGTD